MKRILILTLLMAAWAAPATLLLPGRGAGALTAATRRADVPKLLGAKEEELADGTTGDSPSTEVWALERTRRLFLLWKGEKLSSVMLTGESSVWKTREGVTLGTPLSTLVKLNGKPLVVQHFDGEHAGEVLSYEKGKLAGYLKGMTVTLTLRVPGYNKLTGDQKVALETPGRLRSDQALLQTLNPRVTTLEVRL